MVRWGTGTSHAPHGHRERRLLWCLSPPPTIFRILRQSSSMDDEEETEDALNRLFLVGRFLNLSLKRKRHITKFECAFDEFCMEF